ncbi:unnamed protein product [Ixodes pacificus]
MQSILHKIISAHIYFHIEEHLSMLCTRFITRYPVVYMTAFHNLFGR